MFSAHVQIVYKLADLGFAKDLSEAAVCRTTLGTMFYIVSCTRFGVSTTPVSMAKAFFTRIEIMKPQQ